MRSRIIITLTCLLFLLFLPSCSRTQMPTYQAKVIEADHVWEGNTLVTYDVAYPVFEEPIYSDLNNVILREVESWNALYSEICSQAELDCQIDMSLTSFGRYVRSKYEVSNTDEELSICFTVEWIADLGNYEPSYTKTFTLDRKANMIYETYTTSKRVY